MKLKNTTHWPEWYLRRAVSWACRQVGLPPSKLKLAEFGVRSDEYVNGVAWMTDRRIRVVVGKNTTTGELSARFGSDGLAYNDKTEAMIAILAHEVEHIHQGYDNAYRPRRVEPGADREMERVLGLFRANRAALEAEWMRKPERVAALSSKPSLVEKRAAHASKMLAEWDRKLATAKRTRAKWAKKVKYYAKKEGA